MAIVVVGVVALVVSGTYAFFFVRLAGEVDNLRGLSDAFPLEETRPNALGENSDRAPLSFLVLGVDGGGTGISDLEKIRGKRSDAMILVNISGNREEVTMVSLMRDLWVDIPGRGTDKINAAISIGGVPLAVETVESLLDIRIDHVVLTDFEGLVGLADLVGGVGVDNPKAFGSTHLRGKQFEAGYQVMTGEELLAFTKERFAFIDGDYQRVRNQRLALMGLAKGLIRSVNPLAPWALLPTITAAKEHVVTDRSLSTFSLIGLAFDLRGFDLNTVGSFTLPTLGTGTSPGGQSIVIPNYPGIYDVSEAMKADRLQALASVLKNSER